MIFLNICAVSIAISSWAFADATVDREISPDVDLRNKSTILVPGCWEAQGHHGYHGAA